MNSILDDFKGAFQKPNNGLIQIILINLVVFVVLFLASIFPEGQALIGKQLKLSSSWTGLLLRPWTLLTYAFTHYSIMHILGNLLGLYWFGRIIEDLLGNSKLIGLYFWGAIAGALAYLATLQIFPGSPGLIGASASVFAIVVGAATYFPNNEIRLMFIGRVKIIWIAAIYLLISIVGVLGNKNFGGNMAHLGGALAGYIFIVLLKNGYDGARPIMATLDFFGRLFKRKPKIKVSYKRNGSSRQAGAATASQEEIDRILDKISHSGYESLSKDEKQKLFHASKNK